jgi:TRAP-type C4-dicarboxylate transport system substrate-binding protein
MISLVEALGATATPLPLGDVYPAFQNGIIDGGDNNWPSYISTAHYEVAPYFIADGHTRAPEMILINTDVWDSFTPEEQEIVEQCALEAATYQRAEWDRAEGEYRKQAEDAGSQIVIPTAEERQQFVDAVSVLYEDPEYAVYADVYEAIRNTQ